MASTMRSETKRTGAVKTAVQLDNKTNTTTEVQGRLCPTRTDGPTPLFQHTLTVSQCQSKQRGMYHKCFTCAHANGR